MNIELTEEDRDNYEKAIMILSYIFSIFNLFIIIFSLFILSTNIKNIRFLKLKLFGLIFIDSISLLLYAIFKDEESLFLELLFSALNSIEFFFFISFLYQIFNNTEISKGVELINPFQIFFLFILIIFSYYKFSLLYREIVNCIQYILILSCLIFLYKYFKNTLTIISSHLKSNDIRNRKIYYYLQILNNISLILLFCYNIIKMIIIFIHNQYIKVFLEVGLNAINQGLKYFIFILFEIIIYTLHNKNYKGNFDETIGINQK